MSRSGDDEVKSILTGSVRDSTFQPPPLPFFEVEFIDALREAGRLVKSDLTYKQIKDYLNDFDTKYREIFRNDGAGLVFPEYMDNEGVRIELEALKESIKNKNKQMKLHSDWDGLPAPLLASTIIHSYDLYKRDNYGPYGYGGGGGNRKKNIKRPKKYSKQMLRLRSNRRKNKNKTHRSRKSRRIFLMKDD
jgi:hypothetical protein